MDSESYNITSVINSGQGFWKKANSGSKEQPVSILLLKTVSISNFTCHSLTLLKVNNSKKINWESKWSLPTTGPDELKDIIIQCLRRYCVPTWIHHQASVCPKYICKHTLLFFCFYSIFLFYLCYFIIINTHTHTHTHTHTLLIKKYRQVALV